MIVTLACPRRSATVLGFTLCSRYGEAIVCLNSCNLTPSSPIRLVNLRNAQDKVDGSLGEPSGWLNTRSSSYLGDGNGGQPGGQLGFGLFSPGITYGEPAGAIAMAHPHPDGSLTVMKVRPEGIAREILCL